MSTRDHWEAVIGLEVHVQLATVSKAFSASAVRFGEPPNTLVDPTVLGLPGALPVFHNRGLHLAIALGLALNCKIRLDSQFARKHYFYPDSPKGYQISQFTEPICEGGAVEVIRDGAIHRVALTRIHLEEDAGKSTHVGARSLVDLNRAGVPLCEIVSEPVIRSAQEAADYMRSLRQMVRYLGVSEADMEKGHMRCDANVSVRPRGQQKLGTRAELKNINSFKFIEKAIEHEITRQITLLEHGESVVQETRLWDSDAKMSRSMRSKEDAMDYRYMPDPDLPPLFISESYVEEIRSELPELPVVAFQRLVTLGLSSTDAEILSHDRDKLAYFDATITAYGHGQGRAKLVANWIQGELASELNRDGQELCNCPIEPQRFAGLLALINTGAISGKIAKGVLATMYSSGDSAEDIVEREALTQISDVAEIEAIVDRLLMENTKQVSKYLAGNQKMLGYFVGQVMKATGGQANPKLVNQILISKIAALSRLDT